jgi:hypothetical protein
MANLTTRSEPVTFGTGIESYQAVKIIREFLDDHGLSDVDADVENWQHRI